MTPANSISVAKLLQNIEKSYDRDKNLFKESKLADADAALYRDGDDEKALWNESASMGLEERIALSKAVLAEHNRADRGRRDEALASMTEEMSSPWASTNLASCFPTWCIC